MVGKGGSVIMGDQRRSPEVKEPVDGIVWEGSCSVEDFSQLKARARWKGGPIIAGLGRERGGWCSRQKKRASW